MQVVAGVPREPSPDLGVFVRGIVVENQVDIEMGRNIGIDVREKGEEFLVSMPSLTLGEDVAGLHVECSEEGVVP